MPDKPVTRTVTVTIEVEYYPWGDSDFPEQADVQQWMQDTAGDYLRYVDKDDEECPVRVWDAK